MSIYPGYPIGEITRFAAIGAILKSKIVGALL